MAEAFTYDGSFFRLTSVHFKKMYLLDTCSIATHRDNSRTVMYSRLHQVYNPDMTYSVKLHNYHGEFEVYTPDGIMDVEMQDTLDGIFFAVPVPDFIVCIRGTFEKFPKVYIAFTATNDEDDEIRHETNQLSTLFTSEDTIVGRIDNYNELTTAMLQHWLNKQLDVIKLMVECNVWTDNSYDTEYTVEIKDGNGVYFGTMKITPDSGNIVKQLQSIPNPKLQRALLNYEFIYIVIHYDISGIPI